MKFDEIETEIIRIALDESAIELKRLKTGGRSAKGHAAATLRQMLEGLEREPAARRKGLH